MPRWTKAELEFVRQNYTTMTAEEIATKLGRTVRAVGGCAGRLGLQDKKNWHKPANIEARVRKFKIWNAQQNRKNPKMKKERFLDS